MRFGTWRGFAPVLAFALAAVFAIGGIATFTSTARAGLIVHTIPREVVAVDVHTGGEYFAPPVPNGVYSKDCLGALAKGLGLIKGGLGGLLHGCCPGCHGAGCNQCGGSGKCGHCDSCTGGGLAHHDGDPCGACGGVGKGCGFCGWRDLLHGHGHTAGCGDGGICSAQGSGKSCGFPGKASTVCTSQQAPIVSSQGPYASWQGACSQSGCGLKMRHFHRLGKGCNACGGGGCGICQGQGTGMLAGTMCGSCGGKGCGLCGGLGLLHHGKGGDPCSACGGKGCKQCCGTGLCAKLLGLPAGLIGKLFHVGDIEYFVGPGGPVPITPGYVPYVVTTRSPRDFLSFPPFVPE